MRRPSHRKSDFLWRGQTRYSFNMRSLRIDHLPFSGIEPV
jgi:hypothetical protein